MCAEQRFAENQIESERSKPGSRASRMDSPVTARTTSRMLPGPRVQTPRTARLSREVLDSVPEHEPSTNAWGLGNRLIPLEDKLNLVREEQADRWKHGKRNMSMEEAKAAFLLNKRDQPPQHIIVGDYRQGERKWCDDSLQRLPYEEVLCRMLGSLEAGQRHMPPIHGSTHSMAGIRDYLLSCCKSCYRRL